MVEPPEGSPDRRRPPFLRDRAGPDRSLRWWSGNAGKLSVTAEFDVSGVRRLQRLIDSADVVIAGGAEIADEAIKYDVAARESLIWVAITPFGLNSARAGQPVTDLTMLGGGGPVWNCGYDDHSIPPIRGGGDQASNIAGLYCAIGTLVALAYRDRSGRGQLVEVNVNAACNVTSEQATYHWLVNAENVVRQTGRHAYHVASSPVQVRCADGFYATSGVLPRQPRQFADLLAWLADLDLLDELPEAVFLEMAAARDRPVDIAAIGADDETTAILSAARDAIRLIASRLPAKEFFLTSQRRGFPAGVVLSPEEAFADEHTAARGFRVPVAHPELGQTFDYPGTPYLFSDSPTTAPTRPPLLGEHDDMVEDLRSTGT